MKPSEASKEILSRYCPRLDDNVVVVRSCSDGRCECLSAHLCADSGAKARLEDSGALAPESAVCRLRPRNIT